jgi:hypothetical protein
LDLVISKALLFKSCYQSTFGETGSFLIGLLGIVVVDEVSPGLPGTEGESALCIYPVRLSIPFGRD